MWQTKLCLGTNRQFGITEAEQLRLFSEIGFEAYFCEWDGETNLRSLKSRGDALGLTLQSVHAPFQRMADMWAFGRQADAAVDELMRCLRDCAEIGAPILVCHAIIGFDKHTPTPEGVENFGKIVKEAGRLGLRIAFENTEGEEYLAALMDAFAGERHVGFCWDTGHELCYNRGKDMLALYGDRLFCTHLNDNLGVKDYNGTITFHDDLHLLPFDGIADWSGIARRLNRCAYQGILTFELNTESKPNRHENDRYGRMKIADYLTEAYMRACRFAALKAAADSKA